MMWRFRYPIVGTIVHYVSYGTPGGEHPKTCRAAIITEVPKEALDAHNNGTLVHLCVLNPKGSFFDHDVPLDEGTGVQDNSNLTSNTCLGINFGGGTWHQIPQWC